MAFEAWRNLCSRNPESRPLQQFRYIGFVPISLSIVERKLNWLEHDSTRCEQSSSLAATFYFKAFSNTPLNGYHSHLHAMFWNYSSPYPKPPVEKIQATSPKMKPKSMWKKWPSGVICKLSRWRSPMPRTWRIAGGSFHEWRKYNIYCRAYNSWKMPTENPNRKLVEVHSGLTGQPKGKSWQQNEIQNAIMATETMAKDSAKDVFIIIFLSKALNSPLACTLTYLY